MPASPFAAPNAATASLVWIRVAAGVALIGLLVVYPPFHVVRRHVADAPKAVASDPAAFDPVAFAAKFWTNRLQPAASHAPDATPLLLALRADPMVAAKTYAHRVGLGNAAYYFVRGSGRVTAVERSRVLIEVAGSIVALRTGPVFGNAVRDGCGLLDVNQVPGLAEFNALSAELNRLVEARVQSSLKTASVGTMLRFSGCAEAPEALPPAGAPRLIFIPLQAEILP